ncbi:MAG: hypothetical protein Q4B73_04385 [Lachnospiraceae bacterium]|nr:hypothetical protein [Lachnospiraceae bacterium]
MELKFGGERKKTERQPGIETMMLTWPECLYRERDGKIRLALLDEADRQGLTPEENKARRYLLEKRYGKTTKDGTPDKYMGAWLEVTFAYEGLKKKKEPSKSSVKSIDKILKSIGLDAYDFGEMGEKVLYDELYHMAVLFINLSLEDKQYSSVILGFGHISEDKLQRKIARDVVKTGYIVPEVVKFKHYELWEKAALEAYVDYFPDMEDYIEGLKSGEITMN